MTTVIPQMMEKNGQKMTSFTYSPFPSLHKCGQVCKYSAKHTITHITPKDSTKGFLGLHFFDNKIVLIKCLHYLSFIEKVK